MPPFFRLLQFAVSGVVYLRGDDVFVRRRATGSEAPQRVGSLASEGRGLLQELQKQPNISRRVSAEWQCMQRVAEFCFCIGELIPHLRSLAPEYHRSSQLSPHIENLLRQLADDALQAGRLTAPIATTVPPVAQWFKAPCAIARDTLYPLQRVGWIGRKETDVVLDRVRYRLRWDRARPLQDVLREVREAAQVFLEGPAQGDGKVNHLLCGFKSTLEQILSAHEPRPRQGYLVLYQDSHHEVQFRNGYCGLVRGPVRSSRDSRQFYFGLLVVGKQRTERMAIRPRMGEGPDLLWIQGRAVHSRCMGGASQYRHLCSPLFSDAEAFTQWLDAGVITALGPPSCRRDGSYPGFRSAPDI